MGASQGKEGEIMAGNKRGRPPLSRSETTVTTTITVTMSQLAFLKAHGEGVVSLGVRRLVDENRKGISKR